MPDLSTQLALWREGKLRQAPPKALLGKLESSFKNKQARLLELGRPTTPREIAEVNRARHEFRADWTRMRSEILEGYDADVEAQRSIANPPRSPELETAMGRKTQVYLPKWQRSYGAMIADAERFEREGDRAGLELVREHIGLVGQPGARRALAEGVGEVLDTYKTDAQHKAELEVRSLEMERDHFDLGTAMRRGGMIRELSQPLSPPAAPVAR